MNLSRVTFEKSSTKMGPAYTTDEIRRVLSMDIPAAVVVNLPSLGGAFLPSKTNLLLYFPELYSVMIYEYNCLRGRIEYKYLGRYGDEPDKPKELPDRYQYTVECIPFLTANSDGRNKGNTIFSYFIHCAGVGSRSVEIRLLYTDTDRNREWIKLYWHDDTLHRSEGELIAKWNQKLHRDNENESNSYLIWKTRRGKRLKEEESVPHIRGYHSEEDNEEY